MTLKDIALIGLGRQKGKKAFVLIAMTLGCATVIILFTFIDTQKRTIESQFDEYGANIIVLPKADTLGLSYGGEFAYYGPYTFHDIDETIASPGKTRLEFFIEKKLFGTTKVRFDAADLTNTDRGRLRTLFDAGIAGGIITASELRDRREGRRFQISLQGTY